MNNLNFGYAIFSKLKINFPELLKDQQIQEFLLSIINKSTSYKMLCSDYRIYLLKEAEIIKEKKGKYYLNFLFFDTKMMEKTKKLVGILGNEVSQILRNNMDIIESIYKSSTLVKYPLIHIKSIMLIGRFDVILDTCILRRIKPPTYKNGIYFLWGYIGDWGFEGLSHKCIREENNKAWVRFSFIKDYITPFNSKEAPYISKLDSDKFEEFLKKLAETVIEIVLLNIEPPRKFISTYNYVLTKLVQVYAINILRKNKVLLDQKNLDYIIEYSNGNN